jgi:hypothetical protein
MPRSARISRLKRGGYQMRMIVLFILGSAMILYAGAALDTFGISKLYETKPGTREWNSAHWSNGHARLIQYDGDAYDPTGWTDNHSSGDNDSLYINGNGMLMINGEGPRFHINSTERYSGSGPTPIMAPQSFLNTEATGYYRRLTTGGSAYDGMEIQVRTDPLAHGSTGGNVCDATGLASRFRDDGKWDWEKELKHPASTVYSTKYNYDAPLFGQGTIPLNRWIGMKFLVYNIDNNTHVKLETYIDTVSDVTNGPPANGGTWKFVGSMIDTGNNWPGADISGCPGLTQNMAVTVGHGTMLIRTDGEACNWKMLSIREIDPNSPTSAAFRQPRYESKEFRLSVINQGRGLRIGNPSMSALSINIFDPKGRIIRAASLPPGASEFSLEGTGAGIRLVKVSSDGGLQRILMIR